MGLQEIFRSVFGRHYHETKRYNQIMSKLQELSAAVADQTTRLSALQTQVNAALAAIPGDGDVAPIVAQVNQNNAQIDSLSQQISEALTPALAAVTPPKVIVPAAPTA